MEKNRETARNLRSRSHIPVIAIVGYTNAGKSTLLNYLTDAGVLEEDKLFATLDHQKLYNGQWSAGVIHRYCRFYRKLPHHLVNAFKVRLRRPNMQT